MKRLISILMESPLYMTLSVRERRSLLTDLAKTYPSVLDSDGEEDLGYESSWAGIVRTQQKT